MAKTQPETPTESALDLGEIEPGVAAGHPLPADGAHPWSPSEFARRANAEKDAALEEHDRLRRLELAAISVAEKLTELRLEAAQKCISLGPR